MKVTFTRFLSVFKISVATLTLVFIVSFPATGQIVVTEGFDLAGPFPANNLPFGWSQQSDTSGTDPDNYWDRINNTASNSDCDPRNGSGMLRYRSNLTAAGENSWVISKPFDLSTRGGVSSNFRFWVYRDPGSAGINDSIQVFINNSPSLTGAVLLTDTANNLTSIRRPCGSAPIVTCGTMAYDPAKWFLYGYTIPAGAAWNISSVFVIIKATSRNGQHIYIDDFSIETYPKSQSFVSCNLDYQNTFEVAPNSTDNLITGTKVIIDGAGTGVIGSSYRIDSICFNTNGSTNPFNDIQRAKLWWTGGTNYFAFSIAQQIPATINPVTSTNITFFPAASFRLDNGANYFWLTYDINSTPLATPGNQVDADFIAIRLFNGTSSLQTPAIGTLTGSREIDVMYCIPFSICSGYNDIDCYINHVTLAGEFPPGINNGLNTFSANLSPCLGGPCPYMTIYPQYEKFAPVPGKTASLIADGTTTYTLQMQVGLNSWSHLAAWIDFNHNGDFYDAGEKLIQTSALPGFGWATVNFTVPLTAYKGNTILRVRERFINNNIDPCANYNCYGESEDYVITILPDCDLLPFLTGWKIWLGGFNDDWSVPANWCGGVPDLTTDAIVLDSAYSTGIIKPTYQPVIKNGVTAQAKKLRIVGNTTLIANAHQSGSLTVADSLSIKDPSSTFKVQSTLNDTAQISNGNIINPNTFILSAGFNKRRMWLNYTQAEFLAKGLIANDVIDTLIFWIRQRGSTVPYNNLTISYYYTTPAVCFPTAGSGIANPPLPVLTPGGVLFTGSPNLSAAGQYFVPTTGGQLKIPLTAPLVWNGSASNLVIEICYDNPANSLNDQSYYTQTTGCRSFYSISQLSGATAGCALLNNTAGVVRYSTDNRPNITFKYHRNYSKFPISVRGHFENNGTFIAGKSVVSFNGTGQQNIDGTVNTTFHELEINNTAHVRQNRAATVEDTLWLTAGRLLLNAKTLTLNNGAAGAITRSAGYLFSEDLPPNYGKLNWKIGNNSGVHTVPFVTVTNNYIPFVFDLKSGTSDLFVGTYRTAANNTPLPAGVTNINNSASGTDNSANMVDRYWIIDDNGTSPVADLTFNYAVSESPGAGAIRSQRYDIASGWQPFTSPQSNPVANQNLSQNINSFSSPWALTLQTQPLPVELLNFAAKPENKKVRLSWSTASETDNDYFEVDRTQNGTDYSFISQVKSHGASTMIQNYFAYDENPLSGIQYYRLKQVDLSGSYKFHGPVAVNFNREFGIVTIVSNENNSLTVVFNSAGEENYSYKVTDVTGRIVITGTVNATKGINNFEMATPLSEGIYTLTIQNGMVSDMRKFFR